MVSKTLMSSRKLIKLIKPHTKKNNKKRDGMRDKLDEGQPPCLRLVVASSDDHPTTTDC